MQPIRRILERNWVLSLVIGLAVVTLWPFVVLVPVNIALGAIDGIGQGVVCAISVYPGAPRLRCPVLASFKSY